MKTNTKVNKKVKTKNVVYEIIITLIVLAFLYPFFIMFFVSVKSPSEALLSPSSIPKAFHFENYVQAWNMMSFPKAFMNSVLVTALSVGGIVIFSGLAGFIIAKSKKKFYKALYIFFIAGIMIPFYTSLVPIMQLMKNLNLLNTRLGLALSYIGRGMPMATFFYVGFIRGLSNEVIESGRIDGANIWTLYWRIVFPMLKSITTTIIILDTLWIWNDFLLPSLVLSKAKLHTIPLSQYAFYGEYGTQWQLAFAAYILAVIPVLIIYILLQKNIIKGITVGAIKG